MATRYCSHDLILRICFSVITTFALINKHAGYLRSVVRTVSRHGVRLVSRPSSALHDSISFLRRIPNNSFHLAFRKRSDHGATIYQEPYY